MSRSDVPSLLMKSGDTESQSGMPRGVDDGIDIVSYPEMNGISSQRALLFRDGRPS